jgi:glycosyltransferase involved in cell wall biosynthesis
MRPRRVAFVLGTAAGGTAVHAAMLARGCADAGIEVHVFGPQSAGRLLAGGQPAAAGVSFQPVVIGDRPRPARDAATIIGLRALLARSRPDVVHAHGLRAGAFAALALAARRRRAALVITVHNAPPAAGGSAAAYRVLERICARRADAVLCVSADLTARMRALRARRVERAVVPAPLARPPAAAVEAARSDIGAAGRPVVLAVGRLAAQKDYDVLLAAAAHWQHRDPRPLLAIAGDGPLAADLARSSRERGVDVRFLGQRADVPALLAAADVFVLASSWEGQPLAVQEALQAGRPVVASRAGGIPELTGEEAALLVPPGDPALLAAAVLSVLDDEATRIRLAAAARGRAGNLPTEADALAAVLALYASLAPIWQRERRAGA